MVENSWGVLTTHSSSLQDVPSLTLRSMPRRSCMTPPGAAALDSTDSPSCSTAPAHTRLVARHRRKRATPLGWNYQFRKRPTGEPCTPSAAVAVAHRATLYAFARSRLARSASPCGACRIRVRRDKDHCGKFSTSIKSVPNDRAGRSYP